MKGGEVLNEYQEAEFQILKIFVDLCEKLGLRYYMACGSVLGAVKYGGFIPWDDDIDVCLLRPEYDIFVREAPKYLPDHLFLQNYESDPNFPSIISKLRDSRTTWIEKGVAHLDINHGIYLDIFPIDGYPMTPKAQKSFEKRKMHHERVRAISYHLKFRPLAVRTNLVLLANKVLGMYSSSYNNMKEYETLLRECLPEQSDVWCNHGNWQGKLEYANRAQYGEGTTATFEGLEVRIPQDYDAYLTQKYGNWRADLPDDKKNSGHFLLHMDTKRPYTEYI